MLLKEAWGGGAGAHRRRTFGSAAPEEEVTEVGSRRSAVRGRGCWVAELLGCCEMRDSFAHFAIFARDNFFTTEHTENTEGEVGVG